MRLNESVPSQNPMSHSHKKLGWACGKRATWQGRQVGVGCVPCWSSAGPSSPASPLSREGRNEDAQSAGEFCEGREEGENMAQELGQDTPSHRG